jgi:choice-of-anchor C domain-containing protein
MQKNPTPRLSVVKRNKGSFHFVFRLSFAWFLTLLLSAQPALLPYVFAAESGESSAPTEIPASSPAPVQQSNVDLTVTALNTSDVITDSQTLAISGNLEVTIQNLGSSATNTQFTVLAFEDRNLNGKYDGGADLQLGFTNVTQSITAAGKTSVSLSLSGTVLFKGNLIYVFADSGNAIPETNENNNVQINETITRKGNLVVSHDINVLATNRAGEMERKFAVNTATWLAGGTFGKKLLAIESSPTDGERDYASSVEDAWRNAGFNLTVTQNYSWTATQLQAFDVVFLAQKDTSLFIDNGLLINYLNNGGSIYLAGGVGPSPSDEAAGWATFLNHFGLAFERGSYNGFFSTPITVLHPIFDGITSLNCGNGQSITSLGVNQLANIIQFHNGQGVYAVSTSTATDLVTSYIRKDDYKFPASTDLTARIGNGGGNTSREILGSELLKNGDFEESPLNPGGYFITLGTGDMNINHWKVSSGDIEYIGTLWQPASGSRSIDLSGNGPGAIEQTIPTVPGKKYRVTYSLAGNIDGGPTVKSMKLSAGTQSEIFTFDITGKNHGNMGWVRKAWDFVANSPTTLIRFENTGSGPYGPAIDKVGVSEVISAGGTEPGAVVPPNANVSFYLGDPAGGGTLIGKTQTSKSLAPGEYEDVKITWNNPPAGIHSIVVIADDDGTGKGFITEGDELNNKANANIALGFGPFPLVDDLLTRFKDGVVDLRWTAVPGAASYNIYRRSGNQPAQFIKRGHFTNFASFSDSGLTNGTTYYYSVRWVDTNGKESGDGTEASATPTSQQDRAKNDVPPTIISVPVTRAKSDSPYSYRMRAVDPDPGDSLTYTLPAPLPGMTINSVTGLVQWTPTLANAGYNDVQVRVEDARKRFATQTYRLFVEIPNQPPQVNAGADQTVMVTTGATLNGRVQDDGLPFGGGLNTRWAKVSGPGTVTFANANAEDTTATFSVKGTYVLRLTASDSQGSSSDEVTMNVVREFASRVYTLNSDFNEGTLSNVDMRVPNQLQLGEKAQPFNFIWVAVSSKGTIVKIDTDTGQVTGEYYTSPEGQPKNPSRTTVDLNGNVWVTNRDGNSVTRVGLLENGQCKDRNGNGRIDTSQGLNDIKPWTNLNGVDTNGGVTTAQDECICNYVRVSSSGTRHLSVTKDNDVWVSGTGSRVFDLLDGITGQIKRMEGSVGYGGYGGLIDRNGVIWSAGWGHLLRWDTTNPLSGPNGVNWTGYNSPSYGLAVDSQGNIWTSSNQDDKISKYSSAGILLGRFYQGHSIAQGVAVDKNDHVWVAHALSPAGGASSVGHLKNDGTYIGSVNVGDGPTGVAVDSKGKIWATLHNGRKVVRINPNAGLVGADGVTRVGTVDFTSVDLGGNLYNYSDMTGSTLSGAPLSGTWSVVFDSKLADAEWGRINWNAQICGDGTLTVTAASSNNGTTFSTAQNVSRGDDLTVANGRYLKITVLFKRATTGESPVLYDLSVGTDGYLPPVPINTAPTVDAGVDQLIALANPAKLKGSVCDDALPLGKTIATTWSKVSGPGTVTFTAANAIVTQAKFDQVGTYVLRVTANDGEKSAADDITITVENNNRPPVITSQPVTQGYSTKAYSYPVVASDPNAGDTLTYSLPTAPSGMTINATTGLIQWTPTAAQLGNHNVKVVVADQLGASAEQSYTINVTDPAANRAPKITSTAITGAAVGVPYVYPATATDPDPGEVLTWNLDVAPAGMSVNSATGQIQWTPSATQEGNHNVTVKVRDVGGLSDTQSFTVKVVASLQPVFVDLTTPIPGATITKITDLKGIVRDPNGTDGPPTTWKVELRVDGSNQYKTIGSGTGAVEDAKIATIDPTNLPNGVIYIKLSAIKGLDYQSVEYPYSIAGDLKLGNFEIAFTDLTIPVAGIPISITRSYNSLYTATKGEFGQGWRLALAGNVVDTAAEPPNGEETFTNATRVYVTRPDGRRVGFTFAPYQFHPFFLIYKPYFKPDPGVTDTLEVPEAHLWGGPGGYFEDLFELYNPRLYTLKTKEGIKYEIDEIEGLKKVTDLNGNTLTVKPEGLFHSSGIRVSFERDAQGRITKITEPNDPTRTPGTLKYAYDSLGNLLSFTDQSNAVTKYSYTYPQFPNYLSKIEDALGRAVARNVVDSEGRLIGICDANGDPATLNGCTKLEPVASASKQTIFNARGFKTELFLDERGNVLTERKWLDATNFLDTVRTYDANNNVLTDTDPAGNAKRFTYDDRSNRLTATDPGGRTTTYTYNAGNKVTSVTDPANNVTTYRYDAKDNLEFVTDAMNNVTQYKYNAQGQRSEMIDAINNSWKWAYDDNGNLKTWADPFGKSIQFTFNASGELLTRIDRNNRRIDFEYDADHRPIKETWDTTPKRITNYTYNTLGQLTSATDPDSALAITYDGIGRQKSVDNQGTPGAPRLVISYDYDANGNVTHVRDSLGGVTEHIYDPLDRMNKVMQYGTNVNEKRVDMVYDNASFLREIKRFSNLAGTQGVANTFYDYDCGGCGGPVKSIHHRKASDDSVIHDLNFTRDSLGNVINSSNAEGTHNYIYDALLRLKIATHSQTAIQPNEFYNYDTVGNRIKSHLSDSYRYSYQDVGKGNRLIQDAKDIYEYDDEGSLISSIDRTTNWHTSYKYDHRNLLTHTIVTNATGDVVRSAKYTYDVFNRRISTVANSQKSFISYDGQNPILILGEGSIIQSRRLYAQLIDSILANEAGAISQWFLTDQVGSVCDLIDNSGNIINHYAYDSFGRLLFQSDQSVTNDLLYTGRESNQELDMLYYRARNYYPRIGRFGQEDPIEPFNYEYVDNNPLFYIDPSGTTFGEYNTLGDNNVKRNAPAARGVGCAVKIWLFRLVLIVNSLTDPSGGDGPLDFGNLRPRKEEVAECVVRKRRRWWGK